MSGLLKSSVFVGAAVFATAILVYASSRTFGFVRIDDAFYVFENAHIQNGLDAKTVKWAFTDVGYAENWHPLTWLSHAADISLCRALGLEADKTEANGAKLMHAENVLLHAFNAVLLFLLLIFLCRNVPVAGVFAIFWAVHPLRCEVVCWVAERKELVSVAFMLLTMIVWVAGRSATGVRAAASYVVALASFALALLAKPVAVSLPVILFAYDRIICRQRFVRTAVKTLPFAALSASSCVLTMLAQDYAIRVGTQLSLLERVACAVEAPAIYLIQTAWPFGLSLSYPLPTLSSWPYFATGVLLLVAMAGILVWRLVRPSGFNGLLTFACAWCYVGLVPMLGIVKVGTEPHSDRYTYWIGCGLSAVLAMSAVRWRRVWCQHGTWAGRGALALAAVLACLAIFRTNLWRDSIPLFADAVAKSDNETLGFLLADAYSHQKPDGERRGEDVLRTILSRKRTPRARGYLALYLAQKNEIKPTIKTFSGEMRETSFDEARLLARYVIEENQDGCDTALAALAWADMRDRRYADAVRHMELALECGYEEQRYKFKLDDWKKLASEEKRKK